MTAPHLRLERPSTRFPTRLAVELSLDGEPGDIHGLIDPGGSGCPTAHRCLEALETA